MKYSHTDTSFLVVFLSMTMDAMLTFMVLTNKPGIRMPVLMMLQLHTKPITCSTVIITINQVKKLEPTSWFA